MGKTVNQYIFRGPCLFAGAAPAPRDSARGLDRGAHAHAMAPLIRPLCS